MKQQISGSGLGDDTYANSNGIPSWVLKAPDDLARNTIERQYYQAVGTVINAKKYYETAKTTVDPVITQKLQDIMRRIDERADHLANTLKKSVIDIPSSFLWGEEEIRNKLKLLIGLGRHGMAAEAFALAQKDIIRRVLRNVEASGDPFTYTSDLTKSFFSTLIETSESFFQLFSEHKDDPQIISLLFGWAHKQLYSFTLVLTKQIGLGISEYAAMIFIQLRRISNADTNTTTKGDDHQATTAISFHHVQNIKDVNLLAFKGPFSFVSSCLTISFAEAKKLDAIGLQGVSGLGYMLVPEIQKLISSYADDICTELTSQIKQETWQDFRQRSGLVVISPNDYLSKSNSNIYTSYDDANETVSFTYDWLITLLSHFLYEIWLLLEGTPSINTNTSTPVTKTTKGSSSIKPYSRADVCGIETSTVTTVMRLITRYIVGILITILITTSTTTTTTTTIIITTIIIIIIIRIGCC